MLLPQEGVSGKVLVLDLIGGFVEVLPRYSNPAFIYEYFGSPDTEYITLTPVHCLITVGRWTTQCTSGVNR